MPYLAHSANRAGVAEAQIDHLLPVADRAANLAGPSGLADLARVAGLLHDLGKYSRLFQARLEGKANKVDHWSSGAWFALMRYRHPGIPVALAVAGHHVGLQQADKDSLRAMSPDRLRSHHPLGLRIPDEDLDELLSRSTKDGVTVPQVLQATINHDAPAAGWMLATRLLFSALVDADFLETEAHFEGTTQAPRLYRSVAPPLLAAKALRQVLQHVGSLAANSEASPAVTAIRRDLLESCLVAADLPPGLFTLTAPTGAGKTLAMLAFALKHAAAHDLRRVVTVIPYLTIIEQTAAVYREALGHSLPEGYLLEHHSLAGIRPSNDEQAILSDSEIDAERHRRQLTENWDSPVLVTTSVQFLESLFANRPGPCRKLHQLARAVVLLDEVQTLPTRLAVPTLAALGELASAYGSTIVLATATQPAFTHLDGSVRLHSQAGWRPQEVVPLGLRLFSRASRVKVAWPDLDRPTSWGELASSLADAGSALCVVNLKRHAVGLIEHLRSSYPDLPVFHLSTSMCPLHRETTLRIVRGKLKAEEPCLLVSTQCVEAGVDVDFPSVFRAFGPLDAIAQAAGRCNRHGRMSVLGTVNVFLPEDDSYPPGGGYSQAAGVTRALLRELGPAGVDIDDPGLYQMYFQRLYDLTRPGELHRELLDAIQVKDFAAVARLYRIVDQDAVNVLVPHDPRAFASLCDELHAKGTLTADWVRRARPHTVSLFRSSLEHTPNLEPAPIAKGGVSDEWFLCTSLGDYDPLYGYSPKTQFFI
ncbi:MAG TPA: CRISPR-associated endonuclease Cas3'' [Thermoanaerobaculaceae bacterium]|nr:CRISPR-associated endonuclease Cas3'' [Thermoanaerobaculaceae bacterium]